MGAIDLQAMAMALSCCWVPPIQKMNRHKPTPHTCTSVGLLVMISSAIGLQLTHIGLMLFMSTRPWFLAGTGTAHLVSCSVYIKHRCFCINHPALTINCGVCFMYLQNALDDPYQWHMHGLFLSHILLMRPLSALDTSSDTYVLRCQPPKHDEEAADPDIAFTQPQHTGLHRLETAAITTAAVNAAANKKKNKTIVCCYVQNPVTSTAWLAANAQLLSPLVSMTVDSRQFCEPLYRTRPVFIIVATHILLSFVAILVRPDQHVNLLSLCNFAQSFRFQFLGVVFGGLFAYAVLVSSTRLLLRQHQQRRVQPQ